MVNERFLRDHSSASQCRRKGTLTWHILAYRQAMHFREMVHCGWMDPTAVKNRCRICCLINMIIFLPIFRIYLYFRSCIWHMRLPGTGSFWSFWLCQVFCLLWPSVVKRIVVNSVVLLFFWCYLRIIMISIRTPLEKCLMLATLTIILSNKTSVGRVLPHALHFYFVVVSSVVSIEHRRMNSC